MFLLASIMLIRTRNEENASSVPSSTTTPKSLPYRCVCVTHGLWFTLINVGLRKKKRKTNESMGWEEGGREGCGGRNSIRSVAERECVGEGVREEEVSNGENSF